MKIPSIMYGGRTGHKRRSNILVVILCLLFTPYYQGPVPVDSHPSIDSSHSPVTKSELWQGLSNADLDKRLCYEIIGFAFRHTKSWLTTDSLHIKKIWAILMECCGYRSVCLLR